MNTTSRSTDKRNSAMTAFTRVYVGAVIAAGALVLASFAPRELANPTLALTLLAAMVLVSLFKLRLPLGRGQSTISMAYVIDFLVIVTAGADLAMAIAAVGVVVQCTLRVRRRQPWYRAAFSVATVALAVQAAGWTWAALGGTIAEPSLATTVLPLAAAAIPYFAINSGLIAGAIALSSGASPSALWQQTFLRTAPGFLATAAAVAFMHSLVTREALLLLPAIALPMLVCHLAYAYWFRQMAEDAPAVQALT